MDTVTVHPSLYEILVRDREAGHARCADPDSAAELLPRFVGLGLLGFGAYGAVMGLVRWQLPPVDPYAVWEPWPLAGRYLLAYAGAFFGTKVAILPTYYFYALLAGIRTHGWRIAIEVMRAQATQAMVVLGLLPLFLAAGLGAAALGSGGLRQLIVWVGTILPFIAGLPGTAILYASLRRMARQAVPEDEPWSPGRRGSMPGLLAVAWTGLFAFMAPVGVWGIWQALS